MAPREWRPMLGRRNLSSLLLGAVGARALNVQSSLASGSSALTFAPSQAERESDIPLPNLQYPPGDVRRYGAAPNGPQGAVDNTAVLGKVMQMMRRGGGRITFPGGDWSFHLDVSGSGGAIVIVEGNGSTFRPASGGSAGSAVVYADNSLLPERFRGTDVQFNNCNFIGRLWGSDTRGDIDYTVYLDGSSATFYNCTFQYGRLAAFYSMYGQYSEFWSCEFGPCGHSGASTGCMLDSHSAAAASNEVIFERCKFFVCSNFLWIKGAFLTRIRDCTFQGAPPSGTAGIILDADATGQGAVGTIIDGCWFEVNHVPHILGRVCRDVRLHMNHFFSSGGSNEIVFKWCQNLQGSDNDSYADLAMTVTHPPGAGAPCITWRGGNIVPRLDFRGSTALASVDIQCSSAGLRRRENILSSSGQDDRSGMPLLAADEFGFRSQVRRGMATPLFGVVFEADGTPRGTRNLLLDVELFAWDDSPYHEAGARCARRQRFHAFVTDDGTGPQAYTYSLGDAVDLGPASGRRLGPMSLQASASGSFRGGDAAVTWEASFAGDDATSTEVVSATIGYRVRAMSTGRFRVSRL